MIVHVTVRVPNTGNGEDYQMKFEQALDIREGDITLDKIESMPDAVAKFVRESIEILNITAADIIEEKEIEAAELKAARESEAASDDG